MLVLGCHHNHRRRRHHHDRHHHCPQHQPLPATTTTTTNKQNKHTASNNQPRAIIISQATRKSASRYFDHSFRHILSSAESFYCHCWRRFLRQELPRQRLAEWLGSCTKLMMACMHALALRKARGEDDSDADVLFTSVLGEGFASTVSSIAECVVRVCVGAGVRVCGCGCAGVRVCGCADVGVGCCADVGLWVWVWVWGDGVGVGAVPGWPRNSTGGIIIIALVGG